MWTPTRRQKVTAPPHRSFSPRAPLLGFFCLLRPVLSVGYRVRTEPRSHPATVKSANAVQVGFSIKNLLSSNINTAPTCLALKSAYSSQRTNPHKHLHKPEKCCRFHRSKMDEAWRKRVRLPHVLRPLLLSPFSSCAPTPTTSSTDAAPESSDPKGEMPAFSGLFSSCPASRESFHRYFFILPSLHSFHSSPFRSFPSRMRERFEWKTCCFAIDFAGGKKFFAKLAPLEVEWLVKVQTQFVFAHLRHRSACSLETIADSNINISMRFCSMLLWPVPR